MAFEELKASFKDWAIQTVPFLRTIPDTSENRIIKHQLIKSATSSSANYRAVCRAKSRADFLNKLKIVEEELDESIFWIELIQELSISNMKANELEKEANELLSITVKSILTSKNKREE